MPDDATPGQDAANLEAMGEAVAYQAAMRQLVIDKLDLRAGAWRVLDFGAGRGDYAVAIHAQTGHAVDCLEPDARLHSCYPPGLAVVESLAHIAPASLEQVYTLNVLEHIKDEVAALRELAACCRPGAAVFILVPANPALWTPMDTLVGHQRRYTAAGLRQAVSAAGLTVVEEGWFDRTGYFATRAYQALHRAGLLKTTGAGAVSKLQIRVFDVLFRRVEPLLAALKLPFGKNRWILARAPAQES